MNKPHFVFCVSLLKDLDCFPVFCFVLKLFGKTSRSESLGGRAQFILVSVTKMNFKIFPQIYT
jgi:hypothetical protein